MAFEVFPPTLFGLPLEGWTVIPAEGGEFESATIHWESGTVVGRGHLSQYRRFEDRLNEDLALGGLTGRMVDNVILLECQAESQEAALSTATAAVERFLMHIELSIGLTVTYQRQFVERPDGTVWHPKDMTFVLAHQYNLEPLREAVSGGSDSDVFADASLARAMQYFEHGEYLNMLQTEIWSIMPKHHGAQLMSSAFLNLYKAATVIIGDKSKDRDHQSRYRSIGLDKTFYGEIEWLHSVRDDFDVAHHEIDTSRVGEVRKAYGRAKQIVLTILRSYRETLESNSG